MKQETSNADDVEPLGVGNGFISQDSTVPVDPASAVGAGTVHQDPAEEEKKPSANDGETDEDRVWSKRPPGRRTGLLHPRSRGRDDKSGEPERGNNAGEQSELNAASSDEASSNSIRSLGPIADFWRRYDKLADYHDRKMSDNLNANLDVLLIFAALFSAINTTFISMTMPLLTPDPSDKTNALLELLVLRAENNTLTSTDLTPPFSPPTASIAVNCILYASLCCSLLAAMGAMLGKEWLQSFDRSGQTGLLVEQGRLRQRKLNGVQEWRMEAILLFLPNLLLSSVTLFFCGLALYLFPINRAIAGIIIASVGAGVTVWCATVLAGAIAQHCPYQSAATRALRWAGHWLPSFWEDFRSSGWEGTWSLISQVPVAARKGFDALLRWVTRCLRRVKALTHRKEPGIQAKAPDQVTITQIDISEDDITDIQAAYWLFETASDRYDRTAAMHVMRNASEKARSRILTDTESWRRFVVFIKDTFDMFHSHPGKKNREVAEHSGRVIFHFLAQCPKSDYKWRTISELAAGGSRGMGRQFLEAIGIAFENFKPQDFDSDLTLRVTFLHALIAAHHNPVEVYDWSELKALIADSSPVSDAFGIRLSSVVMYKSFGKSCEGLEELDEAFDKIRWQDQARDAYESEGLWKSIIRGLASGVPALQSVGGRSHSRLEVVEICTVYLAKANELYQKERPSPNLCLLLRSSLEKLVLHFGRPTDAHTPDAPVGKLSMEAVRTLRIMYPQNPLQRGSSGLDELPLQTCWRAFEQVVASLDASPGAAQDLGPDSILEAFQWLSDSFEESELVDGFTNYPRIPAFITTGLTEENSERQAKWLNFFVNRRDWFILPMRRVWRTANLGAKLVEVLKRPPTWGKDIQILRVLEHSIYGSSYWSSSLVDEGFIPAVAEAILHIDKTREQLHTEWRALLGRMLAVMLEAWEDTRRSDRCNNWAAQEMIHVIRHSSLYMERSLNSKEEKSKDVLRFIRLVDHLHNRRSLSAFIPCNADVAIRSMFCELQRRAEAEAENHKASDVGRRRWFQRLLSPSNRDLLANAYKISQRINWNYVPYGLPETPMLCSRPDFVGTQLL